MREPAPKIDPRTAPDIFEQVAELIKQRLAAAAPGPNWEGFDPTRGTSRALLKVFARFGELITDRLNRVPDKNFLAFLDLLGAALLPPRSARVPLTFRLAEGAGGAVVPARTEVAAVAAAGEEEPAVFATESELIVTAVRLKAAFTRDRTSDAYADHFLLLSASGVRGQEPVFQAAPPTARPIEHVLYIAHDKIFTHPGERTSITIKPTLSGEGRPNVAAEVWDEAKGDWIEKWRGEITGIANFDLKGIKPSPTAINEIVKRWLRVRLIDKITAATKLPAMSAITFSATFKRENQSIERAFTNSIPVDLSRGFYPFGESPLPGDTFYLKLDPDFAEADGTVTLDVVLSLVGQTPTPAQLNAAVAWRFWNGTAWTPFEPNKLTDNTEGFKKPTDTAGAKISFTLQASPKLTQVNGVEGYWVSARLETGGYGPRAELKVVKDGDNYTYTSIAAAAPRISSIRVSYETNLTNKEPEAVVAYNDFTYENRAALSDTDKAKFVPFRASNDAPPAFYLGFAPPANLTGMPNSKLSLYVHASGESDATERPEIEWQYATGAGKGDWASLTVIDATANFTASGVIEFLAPPDFAPRAEFGETLYWLRAVRKSGKYTSEPQIAALLLNTVMASHATRIKDEVMGSSDGSKNQTFRTTLAPVLEGQWLEVRELEMPSRMEQDEIKKHGGEDAISVVRDEAGRPLEVWVRWQQVADFYGSGPRDRHYVLDHLAGEARFGDGISGMIPPLASGNLRMASYRTGGGQSGNKPAGTITQLRTSLPYVEGVNNYVAASGGAEAEAYESLVERMPRMIRHGGRAVTYEDYEDLAMLASPDVARARCVRVYEEEDVGNVRLIVVPRLTDSEPLPTLEMKRRVQEFIDERKSPLVELTVVEPNYVKVGVTVGIAPTSLEIAGELKLAVLEKITGFLHPLTGGFAGEGWDFSRQPHHSDLYYLIEQIAGVDHVISLDMKLTPDQDMSEYQLVASGKHEVTCRF
ncbi:MAG TPA: putative baseplate assembly protein [Blastocatellia bacterium]|nr:putative baseplate assembly protein [Blastocatellia bacterium]